MNTAFSLETSIRAYYAVYYFKLAQLLEHRGVLVDQTDPRVVNASLEYPIRIVICTDITLVFLEAGKGGAGSPFGIETFQGNGEEFQNLNQNSFTVTVTSSSPLHWHRARVGTLEFIANGHLPNAWSESEALHYASEAFLSLISPDSDRSLQQFAKISSAIDELDRLVQSRADEAQLQAHLTEHLSILKLVFNGSEPRVKERVGPSYITDFSVKQAHCKLLIEIESATHEILTKNKSDLLAPVTHAIGQVQDWLDWGDENQGQSKEDLLDGCDRLEGVVIMGHTKNLLRKFRRVIAKRVKRERIRFLSWDEFVQEARNALNSLQ
jgi:Domain of unknown function (DUF4263)